MPKIGTIKVSYRRSLQPRQYESAESSVALDLVFDENERPDIDEVISGELTRVQGHVEKQLGLSSKAPTAKSDPTKPATAPKTTTGAGSGAGAPATKNSTGATAPKPASPSKPAAPKPASAPKAAAPKPAAKTEDVPAYTKGDMMKAISHTMTALQKKGITDGNERINKIVLGYLPDDKPPVSYARIPEHSWGDFISDVEKLKSAEE